MTPGNILITSNKLNDSAIGLISIKFDMDNIKTKVFKMNFEKIQHILVQALRER